jgi:alpha-1,2-mannosyltransferase
MMRLRDVSIETRMMLVGVAAWDLFIARRPFTDFDHTDFATFYDTGRAWRAGTDLYEPLRGAVNLNPPIATFMFAPFAVLAEPVAVLLWMIVNLTCFAISLRIIVRELDLADSPTTIATGLVFLGLLQPTLHMLWAANLAWILTLPATLAWRDARHGRDTSAGLWLGFVLALKPLFLVFVPYWALRRNWRSIASAVAVGVASLLVGWLALGLDAYRSWFEAGRSVTWFGNSMNGSLMGTITKSVPKDWVMVLVYLLTAGVIACLGMCMLREKNIDREWSLVWIASLLVSPLGWMYYFALAAGPLIGTLRWQARTPAVVAVAVALCIPAPVVYNLAPAQPAVVWLANTLSGLATLTLFAVLVVRR